MTASLQTDLISYLADNEGEIHSMKIKTFHRNAGQRIDQEYEDMLTQDIENSHGTLYNDWQIREREYAFMRAYCKCGEQLNSDNGPLCSMCDADESDSTVQSFH